MKYMTDEDNEKSKRHETLAKQLTKAQAEHMRVYENYYADKATAEELIQAREKLDKIHEEWRSTIVVLKNTKNSSPL